MKALFGRRLLAKTLIVLLGLTVTGLLALLAYSQIPPKYEARAAVILLPGEGNIPASGNPFLFLTQVSQARDVLIKIANSEATRADLGDVDYVVEQDYTADAPIIAITAIAPGSVKALALKKSLLEELSQQFETLQDNAGAPEGSRMSLMVIYSDDEARQNLKAEMRGLIAVFALGIGLTFAAVAGFDAISRRRSGHEASGADSSKAPPISTPAHLQRGGMEHTYAGVKASNRSDAGSGSPGSADSQLLLK